MDWCEKLIIDWSQVKEAVLAIVAIIAVIIAWRGLNKWQSELRGKAHFETARNLARTVFKVRDAIQSCRAPLILMQEFEGLDPSSPSGSIRADAASGDRAVLQAITERRGGSAHHDLQRKAVTAQSK